MDRSSFVSCARRITWERTNKLQQVVMPAFYDLGEAVFVREVKLSPEDEEIAIFFQYREQSFICNYRELSGVRMCWIEVFFTHLTQEIPNAFKEAFRLALDGIGMQFVLRDDIIILGVSIDHPPDHQELHHLLEMLLVYRSRYLPCFRGMRELASAPFGKDNKAMLDNAIQTIN